ncbi:MAG: hypothetical protein PUD66_00230, partial [Oscillospiraceae bacterium]|nr:hypothetical protein [Oscillospiraceae bacterium]
MSIKYPRERIKSSLYFGPHFRGLLHSGFLPFLPQWADASKIRNPSAGPDFFRKKHSCSLGGKPPNQAEVFLFAAKKGEGYKKPFYGCHYFFIGLPISNSP